jgi:hypothetical protein
MRLGVRHTHSRPCLGGRFRCGAGGRGRRRSVGSDVARCTSPGSHTHIYTCRCGRWPRLLPLPRRARARSNAQPQRPSPPSSPSSTTYATPAVTHTHTHATTTPARERERGHVCVCLCACVYVGACVLGVGVRGSGGSAQIGGMLHHAGVQGWRRRGSSVHPHPHRRRLGQGPQLALTAQTHTQTVRHTAQTDRHTHSLTHT